MSRGDGMTVTLEDLRAAVSKANEGEAWARNHARTVEEDNRRLRIRIAELERQAAGVGVGAG